MKKSRLSSTKTEEDTTDGRLTRARRVANDHGANLKERNEDEGQTGLPTPTNLHCIMCYNEVGSDTLSSSQESVGDYMETVCQAFSIDRLPVQSWGEELELCYTCADSVRTYVAHAKEIESIQRAMEAIKGKWLQSLSAYQDESAFEPHNRIHDYISQRKYF